ncbi:MAG TPA: pilus assembly protein PilM [Planctomycetota bacterium]|nr:pilus assembly protein PilM [Planctomycetota bacterium]
MSTTAGIDLGSEALKGVVLSQNKQGAVEVIAAGTLPLGDLGRMEESADKALAVGVKLKELVRTARLKAGTRRVGASGKATSIRYLQVPPVPPWRLDMLVNYEVQERVSEKEANTYDYHILDVPEVGGQYTVMIGMLKETTAQELLNAAKTSGLGEVELDLEAVALYNAYYHGHGFDPDKTVIIADIGADDLTILLCRNGGLYFARTIMGGGRRFTQVLADELKIDPLEADELKKTQAEISFDVTPSTGRTARIPRVGGATGVMPRTGTVMMARPPRDPGSSAPGAAGTAAAPGANASRPASPGAAPANTGGDETNVDANISDDMPPPLDALDAAKAAETSGTSGAAPGSAPNPAGQSATVITAPPGNLGSVAPIRLPSTPPVESPEEKRRKQMSSALVREAAGLCAALENAVLFSKQQTKLREIKIDRIYLTGGGSKLKGLTEFMSRRMRVEVAPLEPFRQVSLDRLPPEQAAALKAEQHTMAVALGLALSTMKKGAFSFLLWPEALIQKKKFWSRGAYLYYAAALVLTAMGLFLYAPMRNAQALQTNFERTEQAVNDASARAQELKKQYDEYEEFRSRLKQINDNTLSGHYFLNLLAELKNTQRIHDDIWLTSISTTMPQVVRKIGGEGGPAIAAPGAAAANAVAPGERGLPVRRQAAEAVEPDTFQTQRRVYMRGFARGDAGGERRIQKIKDFYTALLPYPDDPENPANLFKDVRPIWFSTEDYKQGTRRLYLQDATFNRVKGAPTAQIWCLDRETGLALRRNVTVGPVLNGWVEISGQGMERTDLMITGPDAGALAETTKLKLEGDDLKVVEGKELKLKAQKFKIEEQYFYLTEFVLEAYTEGTREKAPAKPGEKGDPKAAGAAAGAAPIAPAPAAAPNVAPAIPAVPAVPNAAPAPAVKMAPPVNPVANPAAPAAGQPAAGQPNAAAGQPNAAPAAPAAPEPPKKKKFIVPTKPPEPAK